MFNAMPQRRKTTGLGITVRTGDRGSEPRLRIKIGNLDRQSRLVIWDRYFGPVIRAGNRTKTGTGSRDQGSGLNI